MTVARHVTGPVVVRWGANRHLTFTSISQEGRRWVEEEYESGPTRRTLAPRIGQAALARLVQDGGFPA